MKKKFIVTIPVYKSGNTELLNYISKINSNTLIIPQISSVRTDPSSLAYHIKQKYNKSVIITINTVDTNLRFIQSRILGAELFNLNNFLITKGDATSLQKTPEKQSKDSKAVYEQKTTKVMSSINQMNKGYDFIGNELESKTDCIFGSTVEINQTDNKYLNLIDKKIKLGSSYLISNPIYDGNMYNTFITNFNKKFSDKIKIPIYVSIRMNLPNDSFFDQNYHTCKLSFESNKLNAYIKLLTSLSNFGITNYNLILFDNNNADKESLKEQVLIANKLINFSK
ncbi:MAG: hypothetical protein CL723_00755 [Chloroflexi bacterium]|jgi:5,10-methylenetetrahydrofolate reductase|nr:hypothetical protein [Chloroflexota bacterium]MDP7197237.1 hypothetical protein [SAR202 cluster bacterium]|tara:strand:+ start:24 stop:869 length:846 start_codon:yes stop_codon:yes gene_type:complete